MSDYDIQVKKARISFPHLFVARGFNGGTDNPKYSATFLLHKEKDAAAITAIKAKIAEIAKDFFKDKRLPPADKMCLRDGDNTGRPEYEGHFILTSSEAKRPTVVDKDLTPLVAEDDVIYSGCYVNGFVRLWCQDNQSGKRVNANLLGVQFAGDGDRLTAAAASLPAEDMFSAEAGEFSEDPFA